MVFDISEHSKLTLDGASLSLLITTLAGWLPAIAAIFSIAWSVVRLYETETVQCWMGYPLKRSAARKKAALRRLIKKSNDGQ